MAVARQALIVARSRSATTTVQQSLVHLFLSRFTLTDAELRALTSREVPVGQELFDAMDKTERIRADCRALLSGEAGEGTQAGLDIMEYTSQHLDAGYSKIFKWCSFESRGFSKDTLEVTPTMRSAIGRLKSRPDLLACVAFASSSFSDLTRAPQRHPQRPWHDALVVDPEPLPRRSHPRRTVRPPAPD